MTPARSIKTLMSGLIDYAGLFPPAQLDMKDAVAGYAEYRGGPHAWMLGKFVLPVSRIGEFNDAAAAVLPRGEQSDPWRLTAIVGEDAEADGQRMLKFNCEHFSASSIGHAVIDTAEMKLSARSDPRRARKQIPKFFALYLETELTDDLDAQIVAIGRVGARAKVRTGGAMPEAFPNTQHVVEFLTECIRHEVSFKATAGLHHAVRGEYPLTYEPGAASGSMFGFLNLVVAAAALEAGATIDETQQILEERDIGAFSFSDDGVAWGDRRVSVADIRETRDLMRAFGSCSFSEPVAELAAADLV